MKKRIPFFAFLLFYLVFSFVTFRDYGCTWDEQDTYQGGQELYQYLIHGVPLSFADPEHTYPYTFFLSFLTGPTHYEILHLLNLLFTVFLLWAAYEMLLSEYAGGPWALAGPVFLFLFLPFLGSIPANPKDIPFAIFYFLSLAVLYLYERKFPELRFRWFFAGLLMGVTMSSRIVGFTLLPVMILYDVYLFWTSKKKKKSAPQWIKGKAIEWLGTVVVSQILCALLWPFVGQNYFKNLPIVFWLSAHFPPKFSILFMGGMVDSLTYPWYYLPLWIGITTPLFILGFFIGSFFFYKKAKANNLLALIMTAFALNLGLYFLLHPAIYDGLRHFLFLLPFISLLASIAFIELFRKKAWDMGRKAVAGLTVMGVLFTATDMVRLHPYEYTYFNELVGGFKGAYGNFETDYWVASFKEAIEWLRSNEMKDPGKKYRVFPGVDPPPPQVRIYTDPRLEYVTDKKDADYAIVITRSGLKPGPGEEDKVIHRVEREKAPLCFILEMK